MNGVFKWFFSVIGVECIGKLLQSSDNAVDFIGALK